MKVGKYKEVHRYILEYQTDVNERLTYAIGFSETEKESWVIYLLDDESNTIYNERYKATEEEVRLYIEKILNGLKRNNGKLIESKGDRKWVM